MPSVSIAIPTYNEAEHIALVIRRFLDTNYPDLIEIIIADGGSTDGTQEIVKNLKLIDSRIKLIHNPFKIQASGLNLALEVSSGDIFLRADAHCEYARDYVERCVEALQRSTAINVGGAQRFIASNPFQAGIALASKSFLGSGGAKYRNPNYNGFADTVFLGCFWKKNLQDIAGYCPSSTPNEDSELNLRLNKIEFPAIYISSNIKVWYYPRKTFKSLCIQYFRYGKSRYQTIIKHPQYWQIRGRLPFLILSGLIIFIATLLLYSGINLYLLGFIALCVSLPFLESLRINWIYRNTFTTEIWRGHNNKKPSFLQLWLYCSVATIAIPLAHFLGYGYEFFNSKLKLVLELSDRSLFGEIKRKSTNSKIANLK